MDNLKRRENQSLVSNAKIAQPYYAAAQNVRDALSKEQLVSATKQAEFKIQNPNSYEVKKRTRKTLDGQSIVMLSYRSKNDVQVQFEDGTITNCTYYAFINGLVKHPNASKVGERAQMKCGAWAEVVVERKYHDVDIRFDNGVELKHVSMADFRRGDLYPSVRPYLGERRLMNCELWATVVSIKNDTTVTIRFADGAVLKDVNVDDFRSCKLKSPKIKPLNGYSLQEFAMGFYLIPFCRFKKVPKGYWKDRGFEGFELDFYHPTARVAFEQDGNVHKLQAKIERDVIKNEKCQELGIKLFRFRDEECPPLNGTSIDFCLSKSKEIMPGFIDCKFELEEALKLSRIPFHPDLIDFRRDRDEILDAFAKEYCSPYHYRVGETRKMKDGSIATITTYISSGICKVCFDSNKYLYCSYGEFFNGDVVSKNAKPVYQPLQRF
jgi:hypothetical protein